MKRTFKKLLAVLIAAIMIAGIVPMLALAEAFAKDDGAEEAKTHPNGYINTGMHGVRAVSTAYEKGDMETYYRLSGGTRADLPNKYDSRDYNYITPVRNQGSYGSCWAHAAMGGIEAYMIKHGIPVGTGSAATTSINLSETQHCFFNYSTTYDAEGMLTGDATTLTSSSSKNGLDCGGNGEMSAYTLQRWTGAASESTSALAYSKVSTVASSGLNSQYAYGSNICHVQNSVWIPATNIEGVKQAIMEYGAGNISYYESQSGYVYICTIDTSSTNSSSHKFANHAITIVGWDDTIAVSRFSPNRPSNPGAWICKNSWGASQFDSGYCYISYEDTSVLEGYIYFYDAESIDNYDHNYQYDGTCNVVCFGTGYDSTAEWYLGFANNTKVANVFTATGSQMLKAVALCNWDEALTYTVEIYKNPTTGNPSSGTLMSTQTGYLTYSGYYTIVLDTPVLLSQGDTFSVVVTQSCPTADDNGKYIHTPYDASYNNSDYVSFCYWTHANHGNTSYYQEPDGAWTDCPDNGDYRIKAYTVDYENPYTVTAVSNNTAYGTVSVTGTVITCTPAAGYYVESAEVISGTATVSVNGNTVTVSPSSDCTVRVNFAPKPQYTVNYVVCGASAGSATAYLDDSVTLPATVSVNPEGFTFIGWVAMQIADETETEPTYYAPGAQYTVTGNATLYALYSRVDGEGGSETVYQLVTSAPSNWAGNYVITNSTTNLTTSGLYVFKGVSGSSSGTSIESASNCTVFSSTGMTLSDNALHGVTDSYVFAIAANGSYYTIKSASANSYVGMNSSSYLAAYTSVNSTYCNWTPAINTSGVAQFKNAANGSYPYLGWSTSNSYFWSASTSNANVLRLWKETVLTTSTTYYTTDPVVVEPTYYTVTFKDWNGTVLKTEEVLEGSAATAPANPTREGYTFSGWDKDFSNVTEDLTVTATYTINSYTLTINYVYEDGTTASAAYTQSYNYGASYSVASPAIEGYTPDQATVSGTMGAANVTVTVTYTKDAVQPTLLGDLDCDGDVDFEDVALYYSFLTNKVTLSEQGLANADFNGDGKNNTADISAIYKYILNMN